MEGDLWEKTTGEVHFSARSHVFCFCQKFVGETVAMVLIEGMSTGRGVEERASGWEGEQWPQAAQWPP